MAPRLGEQDMDAYDSSSDEKEYPLDAPIESSSDSDVDNMLTHILEYNSDEFVLFASDDEVLRTLRRLSSNENREAIAYGMNSLQHLLEVISEDLSAVRPEFLTDENVENVLRASVAEIQQELEHDMVDFSGAQFSERWWLDLEEMVSRENREWSPPRRFSIAADPWDIRHLYGRVDLESDDEFRSSNDNLDWRDYGDGR